MRIVKIRVTAIDFYKKLGFEVVSMVFASKKTEIPHVRMDEYFE